jgi:hypothetical protein
MPTSLFDSAADQLERGTRMDRLEARGTLRLALKQAGLDLQTLTLVQLRAVFEKLMPKELEARGISNAAASCKAVMAEVARGAAPAEPVRSTSSDEILKRLGGS